jgi:hypothetical protein
VSQDARAIGTFTATTTAATTTSCAPSGTTGAARSARSAPTTSTPVFEQVRAPLDPRQLIAGERADEIDALPGEDQLIGTQFK